MKKLFVVLMAVVILTPVICLAGSSEKFEQIGEPFLIIVPADYHHDTYMESFGKKYSSEFPNYRSSGVTADKFSQVTTKLLPNQKLAVTVYLVKSWTISRQEIITFLKANNAFLVGAQGLALTFEQKRDQLPIGCITSFDQKEHLWRDIEGHTMELKLFKFGPPNEYHPAFDSWLGPSDALNIGDIFFLCFRDGFTAVEKKQNEIAVEKKQNEIKDLEEKLAKAKEELERLSGK
ncbi:MAG: hypothetical protein PHT40_00650 [Patescibacteria group bacterium]|nr:hypothetical protein [Patescibacteria group bacterium]